MSLTENNNNDDQITTEGVVIPVDWNDNGDPITFAVSTYNEQEYLIDKINRPGRRVVKHLHRKIWMTGTLGAVVNNRRVMTVKCFKPI